jgi:type II secretory pathway pseudopilin PulG
VSSAISPTRRCLSHRSPGFTLVEIQIALLLLALITVLMVGVLRTASQTWTRVSEHQDVAERRLLINQFLRNQLSNIRFVEVRTIDDELMSSFIGSREALHYVAPFPTFQNDGELFWWTLMSRFDEESGGNQLVLQHRPFIESDLVELDEDGQLILISSQLEDEDEEQPEDLVPETLVLADNVAITAMEFYTRDKFGEEFWFDEWEPVKLKPLLIRLTIAEVDAAGNEWAFPELAVAPRFAAR